MLQKKTSWRLKVLNLILPVNLLILAIILFIQLWYLQADVEKNGLTAKRFIAAPILEILNDKPWEEKDIPPWLISVLLEDGVVLYPVMDEAGRDQSFMNKQTSVALDYFVGQMDKVDGELSIAGFKYKGLTGICVYNDALLPHIYRVLQNPRYQVNLFLVVTLIFLLGALVVYNIKKDILELIRAAERLRDLDFDTPIVSRRENEMQPVFTAFERMRQELNSTRKQGVQWIMSITHDLKTPLTSIRGYLEAFRDGVVDSQEEGMAIIDILLGKAGLLGERIDEMLDFSQIVNAQFHNRDDLFSVKDWLDFLTNYFREEAMLYNRNFETVEDCPDYLRVKGSEKQLNRAIINLFDNALRHTGQDNSIRFSALYSKEARSLILRMEDDGEGVLPEERSRIFDLFYKNDHGRNTRGMGIGLSSVKLVSEYYGGAVSCRESDMGGACFEFILPIAEESSEH